MDYMLKPEDFVGVTFWIISVSMVASTAFFFLEAQSVSKHWQTSVRVAGLVTLIAAVHYYYMRDYYLAFGENPTFYRYVDWILTVPLMCVEFYLLTRMAGATKSLMWKLIIASTWMLIAGYIGESFNPEGGSTSHSVTWGVISTLGYLYVLYTAWYGEVAQLAEKSNDEVVKRGVRTLAWFVLVGWAIYPIGYMCMPGGWLSGVMSPSDVDLWYNIADVINKVGFGLVVYNIAVTSKSE
jgi:bacteriorhodopsin